MESTVSFYAGDFAAFHEFGEFLLARRTAGFIREAPKHLAERIYLR